MEALMHKRLSAVLVAITAGLAACSDNTVAPRGGAPDVSSAGHEGGVTTALTPWDTIRFSITIDPSRQTVYSLGAGNTITFPAHSLCDVAQSSYGPTEWDRPCKQATSAVTVQAKAWTDRKGHARVDFDTHLRFVPTAKPAAWVVLSFADFEASLDPFFNILYCPHATGKCYDESLSDPSLLTVRNPLTGRVTRRIKHFSGYNVAAGRDDNAPLDGEMSFNMTANTGSALSVSNSDLKLDDLQSVARAHPRLSANEVTTMLNNIRLVRQFSGYILASG
jgi:predicted small secreted protein